MRPAPVPLEELQASLDAGGYGPSFRGVPKRGATKKRHKPEDVLHISVAKYLRAVIGHEGVASPQGVMWWSYEIRNSGKTITTKTGREINLEGINRKARGVIGGLPDIAILYQGVLNGIELKAGSGLNDAQKLLHPELRKCGASVVVAKDLNDVEAVLRDWGIPLRGML
jgi:hypothetical protein